MQNTFGVLIDGTHIDVSKTERGAKRYATIHGHTTVTIRYNLGYVAKKIAEKINGKWQKLKN